MTEQAVIAAIALSIFACIAFGYWLRGDENRSAASPDEHDDTECNVGRPL